MRGNIIVFGLSILSQCLTGCFGKTYFESCSDAFMFREKYMTLCNDLARQTYYCGSDGHWHYFAIRRRIWVFDDVLGLKLPEDVKLPFAIREYSDNMNQWQTIDCGDDWIKDCGAL